MDKERASAWDVLGGDFWRLAPDSAKPSTEDIDLYLRGLNPGAVCGVLGASSKAVIDEAVQRGLRTMVIDFSARTLSDLAADLGCEGWRAVHHDVLDRPPPELVGIFDVLIADRLINRFVGHEVARFMVNVTSMLRAGGQFRSVIKLGYYESDWPLLEAGRRIGNLASFFDEDSRTIDYSAAGPALDIGVVPHGNIPRDRLLEWYRRRGKESRFELTDVEDFSAATSGQLCFFPIVSESVESGRSMFVWSKREG